MATWYYHVPDMLLAALSYLLLARLLLTPFPTAEHAVGRGLRGLTHPLVAAVGAVTPRMVPLPLLLLATLAWLYAARVLLRVAVAATGLRLS
jgi:hypothetical protein